MGSRNVTMAMIFLLQTTVGILGNFSLLFCYIFLYFTKCKLRLMDLYLKNLTVANSLVILSRGIPETMAALGWKDFLNDVGCKLVFYVHRVARGASIGGTCFLSIFQAITISPRNSRWAQLKVKYPKSMGYPIFVCWFLQMLVNIIFSINVTSNRNSRNITNKGNLVYCSSVRRGKIVHLVHAALFSFVDTVFLGLMVWASGCKIFILYKHKKQVQHIHRNNVSLRSSPETRATKTILVLVSTFVFFYTLSLIIQMFLAILTHPYSWMLNISAIISSSYPTISPFVLMSHNSGISRHCFLGIRMIKSSQLIRNL